MSDKKSANKKSGARSVARLSAVQALYQMELTKVDLPTVLAEFQHQPLNRDPDDDETIEYVDVDEKLFKRIVEGVVRDQVSVDKIVNETLATGWKLPRVEMILRAILRAGTYELKIENDIPTPVVINEYVDVAHAFFDDAEARMTNGVLDKIAAQVRG